MELVLSSIAAGGLIGASDQFLCLIILSVAARFGWVNLSGPMSFMGSDWFVVLVIIFWILSIAPSYATLLSPGIMHVINSITNFLSGFLVPLSSALLALASAGVIASLNPDLKQMLETMFIFTPQGGIGTTGMAISAASATLGTGMTLMKGVSKPAVSASTGIAGNASASIYTTLENLAAVGLMALAYWLTTINPWLLVALTGFLFILITTIMVYGFIQMRKVKRGLTRVLELTQTNPRAGLAIITECVVWGVGWFAWKAWARGTVMFLAWLLFVTVAIAIQAPALAIGLIFPPFPLLVIALCILVYLYVGVSSSRALMEHLSSEKII